MRQQIVESKTSDKLFLTKVRGGTNSLVNISEEQFWLLVEISPLHSDKIISALRDHLVYGDSRKIACERNNVSAGYFSVCLRKLQQVSRVVSLLVSWYVK
ncbi:PapB/FocB family fimbrial expression transcriptional regulator [Escherichia coli]